MKLKIDKNIVFKCCFILFLLAAGMLEIFSGSSFFHSDETIRELVSSSVINSLCSGAILFFVLSSGNSIRHLFKFPICGMVIIIPYLFVVLANFPIIAIITGDAVIVRPFKYVILLLIKCLSIGMVEELICHVVIFPICFGHYAKKGKSVIPPIIISAVIFGSLHFLNLMSGESIADVLLQVGYSSLIGAMCCMVVLLTESIHYAILLHAIFDFGGYFVITLCTGEQWDSLSILIMTVVSVIAFTYSLVIVRKINIKSAAKLFGYEET